MAQIIRPTSVTYDKQQAIEPTDQKTGEHQQLGQTKKVESNEKELPSTEPHRGNQAPTSILKRSAKAVSQTDKKLITFGTSSEVPPNGVEPPDTRSEEKESQIALATELFNTDGDSEHEQLHNMLVMQYVNDCSTKAGSKRALTYETLTEALKNSIGSDNNKLMGIINSAEQAAEKQLNSSAASMGTSVEELTEKIEKFEKRLAALETGASQDSLIKRIENLKAARTELQDAGDANQSYHFKSGLTKGNAPELWKLREILENSETIPLEEIESQASDYVMQQSKETVLESMKVMLDKGHYPFPKLRQAIETRLSQL
ncbi:hypothetical protein [Endozoicomonas elysicola]|uniref:Uncharacterized protein n=1 Tax=Endozoicomonas elysicola TaxID=305900 RepID=A0A081KGI9_9GAMM|nr:hypothetical protein [Endozoicomonas elysicola]KEI73265.1 hypothetical protein GV64_23385 [Endozoicomonas elysicola]